MENKKMIVKSIKIEEEIWINIKRRSQISGIKLQKLLGNYIVDGFNKDMER